MIKYSDLVQYIKDNHINWNTDLFDVLRSFFNQYSLPPHLNPPTQQTFQFSSEEFKEPEDREYTTQDVLNLFST